MTSTVRQSQKQPRSPRIRYYSQVYGDVGSAFPEHKTTHLREQTCIHTVAEFWCTACGTPHCVPQLTHRRCPRFSLGHRAKAPRNKEDNNRGWAGCGRPERKNPPKPPTLEPIRIFPECQSLDLFSPEGRRLLCQKRGRVAQMRGTRSTRGTLNLIMQSWEGETNGEPPTLQATPYRPCIMTCS